MIIAAALNIWLATNALGGTIDSVPGDSKKESANKAASQPNVKQFATSLEAAIHALETLSSPGYFKNNPADQEHAKDLGFESLDQISQATLGKPILVKYFELKKLQNYKSKDDLSTLLADSHETIYPIYVGGSVKSSLTVSDKRSPGDWKWIETGAPNFTQQMEQLHTRFGNKEAYLIHNRALGFRFLGAFIDKELKLFPLSQKAILLSLITRENIIIKEGLEASAHDVFTALAPFSRKLLDQETFKHPHSGNNNDVNH